MTDNQELIRELRKLGYEAAEEGDIVKIVIDPADYIVGHPKLRADLDRLGWHRSYGWKPSRRLTPEERAEYERNTDPFPELRGAAQRQRSAAKKQQHPAQCNREAAQKQQHPEQRNREAVQKQQHPARTGSGTASYRARMAEDLPEKKRSRKAAAPADDMQIPGQMDIFQFLGGAV